MDHKITWTEFRHQIHQHTKNKTTPGPNECTIEMIQHLHQELQEGILDLLNEWWITEYFPDKQLKARIVLL